MKYLSSGEVWSAKRRATVVGVAGVVLVALGVLFSLRDWLPDTVTTVIAILGVAALVYGVALAIQVVLEREPDE